MLPLYILHGTQRPSLRPSQHSLAWGSYVNKEVSSGFIFTIEYHLTLRPHLLGLSITWTLETSKYMVSLRNFSKHWVVFFNQRKDFSVLHCTLLFLGKQILVFVVSEDGDFLCVGLYPVIQALKNGLPSDTEVSKFLYVLPGSFPSVWQKPLGFTLRMVHTVGPWPSGSRC